MKKDLPNIWKEFTKHLSGSHKRILGLINTHTALIKQNQEEILYWKKAHLKLQEQHIKLQDKVKSLSTRSLKKSQRKDKRKEKQSGGGIFTGG